MNPSLTPILIILACITLLAGLLALNKLPALFKRNTTAPATPTLKSYLMVSAIQAGIIGLVSFTVFSLAGNSQGFMFWSLEGVVPWLKYPLFFTWNLMSFFIAIVGMDYINGKSKPIWAQVKN